MSELCLHTVTQLLYCIYCSYSGRATATVKNVKAILTTKYRVVFELNFEKISVTDLGYAKLFCLTGHFITFVAEPSVLNSNHQVQWRKTRGRKLRNVCKR